MEELEKNIDFEKAIEDSMKKIVARKMVEGTVIQITENHDIFVDIGYKADGIIPFKEYSYKENEKPEDEFKIGDSIKAYVVKLNDGEGNVLLSYKRVKYSQGKKELEARIANHEIFEETITQVSKSGLVVDYKGSRIFIPISLSGIPKGENIEGYNGKKIRFKVTEYQPENNKIIGSAKVLMQEEREKELEKFWSKMEVGLELEGRVAGISNYGAFIDLGPIQGLLHVSQMSWERNANPNEIVKQEQQIKVRVIDFDKENQKIALELVGRGENPWNKVEEKYHINEIIQGKVKKIMPFGAFVELEPGVEGLVHISQISEERIAKPEDVLKLDQEVKVKIIALDQKNKKIELSIREAEGREEEGPKVYTF